MPGISSVNDPLLAAYQKDGYIVLPELLGTAEIAALLAETTAIVRGERGGVIGAEPGSGLSDKELLGLVLAIHFPHKCSSLMFDALSQPRIVDVLTRIIGPDVKAMQSMLFVKQAGMPGQAWHQDEHYIATRDRSLCGVWIALDDATIDNGCLWIHPGSHESGVLWPTRAHGDARFDTSEEACDFPYEPEGGVPVEVSAGSVVFFHGYVLHRSLANTRADGFRRALVYHYMSARSLLPWTMGGRRAREDVRDAREDVRDIVMVAGEDPYAWRGIEDVHVPFVRPEDTERARTVYEVLARLRQSSSE